MSHQKILDILQGLPPAERQNRLLRAPDTELCLAMLHMAEEQRNLIYRSVGTGKTQRLRQLLERYRHTRITPQQWEQGCRVVVGLLQGEGGSPQNLRTYYRPSGG